MPVLIKGSDDILVKAQPLIEMVSSSLKRFLTAGAKDDEIEILKNISEPVAR